MLKINIWLFLNSSIGYLIREITGRTNIGGGMLKAEATDLKLFPLNHNFNSLSEINLLATSAESLQSSSISDLIKLQLTKSANEIVNKYFGISESNANKIDNYLLKLVHRREKKAKS